MLRAIVLSLALLVGLGTIIPLATEMAEAGPRKKRKYKKKRKQVRKYSKRWWRLRRLRAKRRRARARQRRARRLRRARLARKRRLARQRRARLARKRRLARNRRARLARKRRLARNRRARLARKRRTLRRKRSYTRRRRPTTARRRRPAKKRSYKKARRAPAAVAKRRRPATRKQAAPAVVAQKRPVKRRAAAKKPVRRNTTPRPVSRPAANDWSRQPAAPRQLQFAVENDATGQKYGSASISVVGPAVENRRVINRRVKTVGGVTTTALRRTVIDQMIREEGWVVNDYQKQVNGRQVYVVVAQAPGADSRVENRMFYFTESEGKIYRVATRAPKDNAEKLAEESEKVLNSLPRSKQPAPQPQIASNRAVINDKKE